MLLFVTVLPENKFRVERKTGMIGKDGEGTFYISNTEDTDKLPDGILVGAYNRTHSITIKKFTSRETARSNGWEALNIMASSENKEGEIVQAEVKPKRERKPKDGTPKEPAGPRLTQIAPKPLGEQKAARAGTKIANMIDLLFPGISAEDLKTKLERKGRALSGRINRVHGYGVNSTLVDDKPFYKLVLPEGMTAPLAHTVAEEKPVKEPKAEAEAGAEGGEKKPKRERKAKKEEAAPATEPATA